MASDYQIGYKRPPKGTRFRPGHSGNPKGRPKGTKNLKTDLLEELQERIQVREGGQPKTLSKQRAMVKSLTNQAIQGDARASSILFTLLQRFYSDEEADRPEVELDAEDRAILERLHARIAKNSTEARGTEADGNA